MSQISGRDRFVTVEGVDLNEVPDGYVIYDNQNSRVHYLNTTAAIIYQLSDGNHTVDEISGLLKQAFNLDEDVDVVTSIENMVEANLICRAD